MDGRERIAWNCRALLGPVGGVRECEMVALGERGAELLTPFLDGTGDLMVA